MTSLYISKNVDHYMQKQCLTQKELCEKSGISRSTLYRIRYGLTNPSSTTLECLADVFGISVEILYEK